MGFIRGSLIFLASFLLFLTIFSGSIFLTLSYSLKYEKIQPQLISISKNLIIEGTNLDDILIEKTEVIKTHCQNNLENLEYVFSYEGYTFIIPCNIVNQSSEVIINYGINYFINKTYYKDYDCNFWDCFEKVEPFFLISEKAKDYWREKFYFTLMISIVLIVFLFLLLEKKSNLPILVGSLLIISAIPLMKFKGMIASSINTILSSRISVSIADLVMIFFNGARSIGIKMIIIGGIAFGLGIILKIYKISFKISDFINKKKEETLKPKKKSK